MSIIDRQLSQTTLSLTRKKKMYFCVLRFTQIHLFFQLGPALFFHLCFRLLKKYKYFFVVFFCSVARKKPTL